MTDVAIHSFIPDSRQLTARGHMASHTEVSPRNFWKGIGHSSLGLEVRVEIGGKWIA